MTDDFHFFEQVHHFPVLSCGLTAWAVLGIDTLHQRRIGPVDESVSREVMGSAHSRRTALRAGEGRRGIGGLQPIHVDGDALYVLWRQLMPRPYLSHQVDNRAVVARRRVHLGGYVHQLPPGAQPGNHAGKLNVVGPLEHVRQFSPVIAGEGVVESRVTFQGGF